MVLKLINPPHIPLAQRQIRWKGDIKRKPNKMLPGITVVEGRVHVRLDTRVVLDKVDGLGVGVPVGAGLVHGGGIGDGSNLGVALNKL